MGMSLAHLTGVLRSWEALQKRSRLLMPQAASLTLKLLCKGRLCGHQEQVGAASLAQPGCAAHAVHVPARCWSAQELPFI